MKRGKTLRKKNKKAAIEMSFQFLFSIILIVVVVFVGFYVIRMFLNNAEKVKLLLAVDDIRTKVDDLSGSDDSQSLMNFKLNSVVKYICFANASLCKQKDIGNNPELINFCRDISNFRNGENMFFYPLNSVGKYNVVSAFEIYCGLESQKKNCLNVSKAICFFRGQNLGHPDEFSFYVWSPNSNSPVYIKAA